jgi:carbonic anhydrase/acetyltransferase-like protein (isoleucine patch superfamily)
MSMQRINGAYIADTARVMGLVELGEDVNIWYGVTVRGDLETITIGRGTNLQENAMVHTDRGYPGTIGEHTTIGHNAIVHGIKVGSHALIGMSATLLKESIVGDCSIIAAGAVVSPGMEIPDGVVAMGIPARVVRDITADERKMLEQSAAHYVEQARLHCDRRDDPRVIRWGQNGKPADKRP